MRISTPVIFAAVFWSGLALGQDPPRIAGSPPLDTVSKEHGDQTQKEPKRDAKNLTDSAHLAPASGISDPTSPTKEPNAADSRAQELEYRNVVAQETIAAASRGMYRVSGFQIILSIAGVLFIWKGYKATLGTLDEAKKSTTAAQDAAKSAGESIDVSRAIADAQARPWISVECRLTEGFHRATTHLGIDGFYLNIRAFAKNHGSSPATNVIFRAETGIPTAESGDLMTKFCDRFRDIPDQTLEAIFPGETKEFSHVVFLPIPDILAYLETVQYKGICPVVYGLIHYKSHHTSGIRQTRFHYGLSEIRDGGCFVFPPDVDNWPQKNIALTGPPRIAAD